MRVKKLKRTGGLSIKSAAMWCAVFAVVGAGALLVTRAATPGIPVSVDSTIPNPTNVAAYGDDRVATITWENPSNMSGIVGFYITWGSQSGGVYTNAKQSTYNITQIQPLVNGTLYNVKVQSVKGSYTTVPVPPGTHEGGSAEEARANGKVSTGATVTVTPSSARVDTLRQQMTGFFDDFNQPAGPFEETKWNTATSACAEFGSTGTFINNQFHSHTQVHSNKTAGVYCDRAQNINRARGIFDITGKTEANPGVIVFDLDGTFMQTARDKFYIDLVPENARLDLAPLDISSHSDTGDAFAADPEMLRISQTNGNIGLIYSDANKQPHGFGTPLVCPDFKGDMDIVNSCYNGNVQAAGEPPLFKNGINYFPTPNVRAKWRIEISDTKVKVFLNGVRVTEGPMPANFAAIKRYNVHFNSFSYNTGKDATYEKEYSSLLHWDNFGFNGPAQTTVVHNYLDGDTNGTFPLVGTGTLSHPVPTNGSRTTKINIPDPIGTPKKARIHVTLGGVHSFIYHNWTTADSITINNKVYNYPNLDAVEQTPHVRGTEVAYNFDPYSFSMNVNPADLVQGLNTIKFNTNSGIAVFNVHIELEYNKGTEPTYTSPTTIFGASTLLAAIQPTLTAHDNYLFIEQDMGLPSGVIDGTTPVPPPPTGDTTAPTVTLSAPVDGASVVAGAGVSAAATATDNVGVTKVEFYIGNTLKATDTSNPYSASLDTTGLAAGSYVIRATAFDAAGNSTTSLTRSITVTSPPDTTKPTAAISSPAAGATLSGAINVQATSSDNTAVTRVEIYVDGALKSSANAATASYALNTGTLTNGSHTFSAKAYDAAGNVGDSAVVTATVANTAPADTAAPTNVVINPPTNNATISGTAATITSSASDNVGVSKVEFYMNNTGAQGSLLLYTDTIAPYTFNLNTTLYANGSYTLISKAYDAVPNSATSAAVVVNINNAPPADTAAPVISLSPAYTTGTVVAGTITLNATATDNVGVSKVEFLVDNALKNTDTSPAYSYQLDTTSLTNAVHTIMATAYDAAGNKTSSPTYSVTVNNANPTPVKNGDFNGDNVVNFRDLLNLLSKYGQTSNVTAYDLNGDGQVNFRDLLNLLSKYGS